MEPCLSLHFQRKALFKEALPGVGIFVCTADPGIEPPIMVTNTILSVMAYDYPPQKLRSLKSNQDCRRLISGTLNEPVGDSTMAKDWLSIKILIDGRDATAIDIEGKVLPTLIRVSSRISNASVILNVDRDMYSNNPDAIRDAMCFFMDEEKGHEIAYVQYPQSFYNLSKNDLYSSSLRVIVELEFLGFDANGGPSYIGTGCFHRRESLCGKKYSKEFKGECRRANKKNEESASFLEDAGKVLASCTYEQNTDWGN
ncbi:Cellulose synthase like E1 [Hibiscus syriacus]|uniref:Cellulose synthase like E1 n=1 Tax=Hibiscus syriacus TaxID=106335 RepID=A0A6A3D455_HIBSY|nr:Cellulose synthase like E1 [Hibiscus syriacus]